jgi:Flp pilus assembly protein CpaB
VGAGQQPGGYPATNGDHRNLAARVVARRRPLPGGRAVIGGFLVALAAVLLFSAYTSATTRPRQLYVVAAHALTAGSRLSPADLAVVPLDLPDPAVRRQVFTSERALVGASVVAPVASGALIEASAVVGRAGAVGTREVSLAVDRARAVAGTLKPGELVDVLGTYGSGAGSFTSVIVRDLPVINIGNVADSLGGSSTTELLTFAAPTELIAEAIANASYAAQVTIVRSADNAPGVAAADDTTPPYRAPSGAS